MKKLIIGFTAIMLLFLYACSSSQAQPAGSLLPPADFKKKVESTEKAVLLDVRTPEEYKDGHLANAVNMNWNDESFGTQIKSLDKNAPVFVYCYAGGRSSAAAKELRKQGFKEVYDMQGGMSAWRTAGLPEVKE
jgi:thioredoxin 1